MNRRRHIYAEEDSPRDVLVKARAFLDAVKELHGVGREPSPVRAAHAGLVPAWNAWARTLDKRNGKRRENLYLSVGGAYTVPQIQRATMELFLEALGIDNPALLRLIAAEDSGEFDVPVTLTWAAALYHVRAHAVIEPTAALQTWLAHTDVGSDVPASLVQLPFPAVFIRFGPEMARAVDDAVWDQVDNPRATCGVYVFETFVEARRCLTFVVIGVDAAQRCEIPQIVQVSFVDPNESLIDAVVRLEEETGTEPGLGSLVPMVQMCTKVLLYLQTAGAVRVDDMRQHETAAKLARVGSKKLSKLERRLVSRYNRIIVAPAQFAQHSPGEMSPHWRRGHLRMQAHGPQFSLRKLMFIAPTLIRADRLNEASAAE